MHAVLPYVLAVVFLCAARNVNGDYFRIQVAQPELLESQSIQDADTNDELDAASEEDGQPRRFKAGDTIAIKFYCQVFDSSFKPPLVDITEPTVQAVNDEDADFANVPANAEELLRESPGSSSQDENVPANAEELLRGIPGKSSQDVSHWQLMGRRIKSFFTRKQAATETDESFIKYSGSIAKAFPMKIDIRLVSVLEPEKIFSWIGRGLTNILTVTNDWGHCEEEVLAVDGVSCRDYEWELLYTIPMDVEESTNDEYRLQFTSSFYGSWVRKPVVRSKIFEVKVATLQYSDLMYHGTDPLRRRDSTDEVKSERIVEIYSSLLRGSMKVDDIIKECLYAPVSFANCRKYRVFRFVDYLRRLEIFQSRIRAMPAKYFGLSDDTELPVYPNFELEKYLLGEQPQRRVLHLAIKALEDDLLETLFGRVPFLKNYYRQRFLEKWEGIVFKRGRQQIVRPEPSYNSKADGEDEDVADLPTLLLARMAHTMRVFKQPSASRNSVRSLVDSFAYHRKAALTNDLPAQGAVDIKKRSLTLLGGVVAGSAVGTSLALGTVAIGAALEGHWYLQQSNYVYYRGQVHLNYVATAYFCPSGLRVAAAA